MASFDSKGAQPLNDCIARLTGKPDKTPLDELVLDFSRQFPGENENEK